MKSASVKELKAALHNLSPIEMLEVCMLMAKYKRENKELLSYLLYEADNEQQYIENIKLGIQLQ